MSSETNFETRLAELNAEKKKTMEEKGYKPFYNFPEGQTDFIVDTSIQPRKGKFDRTIYRIKVGKDDFDWSASKSIEREILEAVTKGNSNFSMLRIGLTKTDTKYKLKVN